MRTGSLVVFLLFVLLTCELLPYSVPRTPSDFTVVAQSQNSIKLTWVHSSTMESGFLIERYDSYTSTTPTEIPVPADSTEYTDSSLTTANQYKYRIKAIGSAGIDSSFTEFRQAITWALLQSTIVSEPPPTDLYILRNPTSGHNYRIDATLSSTLGSMEEYHDRWAFGGNGTDPSKYVYLCGQTEYTISDINPEYVFNGFNYGQFAMRLNGELTWTRFTGNAVQHEIHANLIPAILGNPSPPWFGGMADSGEYTDNTGMCTVKITDTSAP